MGIRVPGTVTLRLVPGYLESGYPCYRYRVPGYPGTRVPDAPVCVPEWLIIYPFFSLPLQRPLLIGLLTVAI